MRVAAGHLDLEPDDRDAFVADTFTRVGSTGSAETAKSVSARESVLTR